MPHAHAPSRIVRQWERLTWLRQGHACDVLRLVTPNGTAVQIYTTTDSEGVGRVIIASPSGVRPLDESTDLAVLAVLIESLPGSSYEEE